MLIYVSINSQGRHPSWPNQPEPPPASAWRSIASALFVNGNYLARVFKRETGHTLLWYHNAIRCEKAKHLLDETDLSVSEVGASVGYVSSAHFSHLFKKMTGVAPSDWRKPETGQPKDLIDLTGLM